jgi:hypothetical protein
MAFSLSDFQNAHQFMPNVYTLDIRKIYPGHLVRGRSMLRLAIAALLYLLKPREKNPGPVGGF